MTTPVNVEAAVKAYLRSQGYEDAARAMEEQADKIKSNQARHTGTVSAQPGTEAARRFALSYGFTSPEKLSESVLFSGVLEGKPSRLVELYGMLEAFIAGSLDAYKTELRSVAFPVFAHFYLDLVLRGADKEAKQLMSTWAAEHSLHYEDEANVQPEPEPELQLFTKLYTDKPREVRRTILSGTPKFNAEALVSAGLDVAKVRALSAVTTPEHAAASDLARRLRAHPFRVSLSRTAGALLDAWLARAPSLLPLAAAINTRAALRIEDRPPRQHFEPALCGPAGDTVLWPALPGAHVAAAKRRRGDAEITGQGQRDLALLLDSEWYAEYLRNVVLQPLDPRAAVASAAEALRKAAAPSDADAALADALEPTVLMTTLINTGASLVCVDTAPDAARVAAGFEDCSARVYRSGPQQGAEGSGSEPPPVRLVGHTKPIYSLSWAPDSRFLLTGGGDGVVRLWDLGWSSGSYGERSEEGSGDSPAKCLMAYKGHKCAIWGVDFSPLGYYFASGGADRTARLWSTDRPQPLRLFVGHMGDVTAVRFHPNAAYLATAGGGGDRTARLWDVRSGRCVRVFAGSCAGLSSVAMCPTGRYLAVGGDDGIVRVWSIATGRQISTLRKHSDAVESLAFSADGAALASGGRDSCVKLCKFVHMCVHDAQVSPFSADGAVLASGGRDSCVKVRMCARMCLHDSQISLFSADGAALASGSPDSRVKIWDFKVTAHQPASDSAAAAAAAPIVGAPHDKAQSAASACERHTFYTKSTPVYGLRYTDRNLLLAAGPYVDDNETVNSKFPERSPGQRL
ncbi:WD40-repeat-containing domain protein [Tribonema minus]|uniref:WD40-repeat-containing domain protein n=1 Tax=Tribonema minus TaxID=303371 RepID=A0A835YMV1_9STRA|nr:WD40-repeat-containing domain protein [Tribonema minus]